MAKRDRWDSSSDEEGDNAKKKPQASALSTKNDDNNIQTATTTTTNPQPTTATTLPTHNPLLQGCRSVYDTYERIDRVSEGTYGIVWKARDLATSDIVALKQIKFDVHQIGRAS